jgi:vancomycin permeability regulator SanA
MKKLNSNFKKIIKCCFILLFFLVLFIASVNAYIIGYSKNDIKTNIVELEKVKIGLVL